MDFSTTVANSAGDSNEPASKLSGEEDAKDTIEEIPVKRSRDFLFENCSSQTQKDFENPDIDMEKQNLEVISLNDLTPVDAALSIEKIRTKIFSRLEVEDLKNCRLVSHSWRKFATIEKVIRKRRICIHKYKALNRFQAPNPIRNQVESLAEISELILNLGGHSFPCHSFKFSGKNVVDEDQDLKNFFQVNGHNLKELWFELYADSLNEDGPNNEANIFKALMEFITELISNQAPNLQRLTIWCVNTFDPIFKSAEEKGTLAWQKMISKNPNSNSNTSLEFLYLNGSASITLLEHILNLAPNINEVLLPYENKNWFIESGNKHVHFLREMDFLPCLDSEDDFLRQVVNGGGRLELRGVYLGLHFIYAGDEKVHKEFAELLTKLLEKCSHSLEDLTWRRMRFLGARIPVLPKVNKIHFDKSDYDSPEEYFFPKGFRMSESFPGLRTISIDLRAIDEHEDPDDILLDNVDEVVPSVTCIQTNDAVLPLEQWGKWFPNANIR